MRRFPGSKAIADLASPCREGVERFVSSMRAGKITVVISATLRPPERAYLMRWSWRLSKREVKARDVPPMVGVDIRWDHGDEAASVDAAAKMVRAFDIVAAPGQNSLHTLGRAIDMTISWRGAITLKDGDDREVRIISTPRSGLNQDLARLGRTFGVIKAAFAGDPPHWSDTGH